ncbi:hypothetical protein AJ80_03181 [Polytolypa hystricis UAMH7299]|uniref:Uncharacterized protein n=1 Tax=Polytolypa hystricis (strain UAMH7299) TaxID=1447883 RepID=A0A2B7YKH2_POLH7|nr:hypothetical protein AJ80_03181 [Polytolypa hystricis UAMH7299]
MYGSIDLSTYRLNTYRRWRAIHVIYGRCRFPLRLLESQFPSVSLGAENADPLLVVVLDEASSLLRNRPESPADAGSYVAMNREFSCLKDFPLWIISLFTESQRDGHALHHHPLNTVHSSCSSYAKYSPACWSDLPVGSIEKDNDSGHGSEKSSKREAPTSELASGKAKKKSKLQRVTMVFRDATNLAG